MCYWAIFFLNPDGFEDDLVGAATTLKKKAWEMMKETNSEQ